jgi:hypothetical protein
LSIAGDQLPVIPSFEVFDKVKLSPTHIGGCWINVGVNNGSIVISMVCVFEHCPASGVKVYVVVCVLSIAGDQLPVKPSFDVVLKFGTELPSQYGPA